MPRDQTQKAPKPRHQPLLVDIQKDSNLVSKIKPPRQQKHLSDDDSEQLLDAKTSHQLLLLAQMQQEELEEEEEEDHDVESMQDVMTGRWRGSYEDDSDSEVEIGTHGPDDVFLEEIEVNEEDVAVLDKLYPTSLDSRRTLADVILSKLEAPQESTLPPSSSGPEAGLDPRVVELFKKAGSSMRGTGRIPKVIKMLPSFPLWKKYLALSDPSQWSPFAFRKVTNIYISSMKPNQVTFFLRYVLLPAARENIEEDQKLNVHYYEALLRALYKPASFFKGILFPLLDGGCTLKEAVIIGSVLSKKSIPSTHLGAAIMNIASKDYTGPRALIIRVLLDKKKDLPYKVLDELVYNFVRVSNRAKTSKQLLPVLWHQSLLTLTQRYSLHLTSDQKDALLDVVRANFHHQISPEIRRELTATPARGQTVDDDVDMT